MARMHIFKGVYMETIFKRSLTQKLCQFTKCLRDLCAVTISVFHRLADRLFSVYQRCEDNAFEPYNNDATRARLDQLLDNQGFLLCISDDDFDSFVALWGWLHRKNECNRYLTYNGL